MSNTTPSETEKLRSALEAAVETIQDYLAYSHDGDPWEEDSRAMGEMDINDYGRDGRLDYALSLLAEPAADTPAPPPPQSHARVKPLEWHAYPGGGDRMAEGQNQQRNFVSRALLPWGSAFFTMEKDGVFTLEGSTEVFFDTEQAAKDAAQTQFDAWIRAALAATATESARSPFKAKEEPDPKLEEVAAAIGFVLDNTRWEDCGDGFKETCRECAAAAMNVIREEE